MGSSTGYGFKSIMFSNKYKLTDQDKRRIKSLMDEIQDKDINFRYFITIDYWYKQTDIIRVIEDNKHLRKLLRTNFHQDLKFFITSEKHLSNAQSKVFLGYHRHILMTDIDDWNVARSRRWEYKKDLIEKKIRRHHHSTPNGKKGLVIRPVEDMDLITSYLTKQIDYPSLNLDKRFIIDATNSDVGKDHYSVKGQKLALIGNQKKFKKIQERFKRCYSLQSQGLVTA